MLSTLYMAAFAFKYWLHDVPFYRLWRIYKVCFVFDTANFALCCLLFLAKCVGALPWW